MLIEEELESDQHDLSDDSDYAASQNQGLMESVRLDAENMSGFDANAEYEIVYLKDNIAIHPTQVENERISGRLRLVKQRSVVYLAWTPYKPSYDRADSFGRNTNLKMVAKDRSMYAIKDVPLSDIHSVRRHTPSLGWQYVIIVLSSGLAYPPLYFYSGGVREFLATLKQLVLIVRSADDANVFLLNNYQDPLQRSLSSLQLPRTLSIANGASLQNLTQSVSSLDSRRYEDHDGQGSSSAFEYNGRQNHRVHDPAHDISIQVLEKFSLLTKFARETTSQIFRENSGFNHHDRRYKSDPVVMNEIAGVPNNSQKAQQETLKSSEPLESDELNLVWGKPRQNPLGVDEWKGFLDSEGRVIDSKALRKRIFYGGIDHNLRKEMWKFLLGYHVYDSTFAEREYLTCAKKTEYETIKLQWKSISETQAKRFTKFRERRGLIEKDVVRTDRTVSYFDGDDNPLVTKLHDILLTYSFYNFDLGYCQGMSDILSPILFVMEDESESFWCFVSLMERLGPNFNRDQNGMHSQLFALSKLVELLDQPLHNYLRQKDCLNYFFCFRWILIQFKREFEYEEIMRLWEVLWTHYLSEHFHLYMCVAILKKYRSKIVREQMDFDTLLKFINDLSGHINLDDIIKDAEALCICAGENGAACIPPGTPPSLPLEEEPGDYSQPGEL